MVQQIRSHLPVQGTWVRPLVWEDSTCHGAAKPMQQLLNLSAATEACARTACGPRRRSRFSDWGRGPCTAAKSSPRLLQLRKPMCSHEDPAQPKIDKNKSIKQKTTDLKPNHRRDLLSVTGSACTQGEERWGYLGVILEFCLPQLRSHHCLQGGSFGLVRGCMDFEKMRQTVSCSWLEVLLWWTWRCIPWLTQVCGSQWNSGQLRMGWDLKHQILYHSSSWILVTSFPLLWSHWSHRWQSQPHYCRLSIRKGL